MRTDDSAPTTNQQNNILVINVFFFLTLRKWRTFQKNMVYRSILNLFHLYSTVLDNVLLRHFRIGSCWALLYSSWCRLLVGLWTSRKKSLLLLDLYPTSKSAHFPVLHYEKKLIIIGSKRKLIKIVKKNIRFLYMKKPFNLAPGQRIVFHRKLCLKTSLAKV